MGQLTSTVPHQSYFTQTRLFEQFDTNLKVMPPLKKIWSAGIDQRVSRKAQLMPLWVTIIRSKKKVKTWVSICQVWASGIETCFAACNTFVTGLDLETLIDKLTLRSACHHGHWQWRHCSRCPAHLTLLSRIQSLYLMKAIPDHKQPILGKTWGVKLLMY